MKLLGYSERGFINALLYEIAFRDRTEAQSVMCKLFTLVVKWPFSTPRPNLFDKCETILVEQSFSQFGVADALFLFNADGGGAAVFCEGKRGQEYTLEDAWQKFICAFREGRPSKGLTSNLFCQLYFKQRLAGSLEAGSNQNSDVGLEFDAAFALPGGRKRKIGENQVVHRALGLLKERLGHVYYLMMIPEKWTDDLTNWWKAEPACPRPKPLLWDLSHWGVITIPDVIEFCEKNGLEKTLEVAKHNCGQLYLKSSTPDDDYWPEGRKKSGVSVIYAPEIEKKTCLHFSWDHDGCALRNYNASLGQPAPDRSKRTSQVFRQIHHEYSPRPLPAGNKILDWRAIIEQQNKLWGGRPVTKGGFLRHAVAGAS